MYRQGKRQDKNEDFRNVALIGGSAFVGVVLTLGGISMYFNQAFSARADHPAPQVYTFPPSKYTVGSPRERVEPLSGSNRLYGTVEVKNGNVARGFLRWDRNEGSWNDLLDGSKDARGSSSLSGIRFGHIKRIETSGRNRASLTLRSGQKVRMQSHSSDLGQGLRGIVIAHAGGGQSELQWSDIKAVDFSAPPSGLDAPGGRLHGTLTTSSGVEFTGHITWDVDEIYSDDVLDGDSNGTRYEIAFGAIKTIHRLSSVSSRVVFHSGKELTVSGTNDVNSENRGITVSDASLGQVNVPWKAFGSVRFHGSGFEESWEDFDGGQPIRGTVTTVSGETVSGDIRWDNDEHQTWEMLNGEADGVEFDIEFSNIAKIEKQGSGSVVTLRDGRSFDLAGSNDVSRGHRGVVVTTGESTITLPWREFRALDLRG